MTEPDVAGRDARDRGPGARGRARKRALDVLFESEARGEPPLRVLEWRRGRTDIAPISEYAAALVEGVVAHQERIDQIIAEHAEGWSLDRMPAVDRAILRIGLYELLWADDVPAAVAIDEALRLASDLSTDDSPRFINGILGRVVGIAEHLRAAGQ